MPAKLENITQSVGSRPQVRGCAEAGAAGGSGVIPWEPRLRGGLRLGGAAGQQQRCRAVVS